ncbi:hypothetical protein SAY87_008357 [Trapa incisa]|uniref:Uncharacterized protein n=1 Tax=Trapa incisa TaxID=236973 RepID=A0AAN7QJC3_9MYRT|nr:hypothetical protein SAY87_008357 [Trapa incisa]
MQTGVCLIRSMRICGRTGSKWKKSSFFLRNSVGHLTSLVVESTPEAAEVSTIERLKVKFQQTLNVLRSFQAKNSERIFDTGCPFSTLFLQCMSQMQQRCHAYINLLAIH